MDQTLEVSNQWGGRIVYCVRHMEAHRRHIFGTLTETPSDKPCPDCRAERQHAEAPAVMRAALLSPNFSHTRVHSLMRGSVCCYHREPGSPTGVKLACALDESRFDALYAELRAAGAIGGGASPLSPTEGR